MSAAVQYADVQPRSVPRTGEVAVDISGCRPLRFVRMGGGARPLFILAAGRALALAPRDSVSGRVRWTVREQAAEDLPPLGGAVLLRSEAGSAHDVDAVLTGAEWAGAMLAHGVPAEVVPGILDDAGCIPALPVCVADASEAVQWAAHRRPDDLERLSTAQQGRTEGVMEGEAFSFSRVSRTPLGAVVGRPHPKRGRRGRRKGFGRYAR